MNDAATPFEQLPGDVKIVINSVCNDFEQQWRSGECPLVESMLGQVQAEHRNVLLDELVALEVAYRRRLGVAIDEEEYRRRFPDQSLGWLDSITDSDEIALSNQTADGSSRRIGNYALVTEIGRGGMGVVYRARDLELGRDVALKTLPSESFIEPIQLQRFQVEAKAAATLDHPNIVPIYEVGNAQGRPYLAMKLIDGGSFVDMLARQEGSSDSRGDERRSAQLVADICDAVQHAHQHGILHRDLKPANILLDAKMTPYVSDFGLAKLIRDRQQATTSMHGLTETNAVLGTPAYMAPEQARGSDVLTTSADTYALGAILYELLTGRRPFLGSTSFEIIQHVIHDDPTPPSRLVRGLPKDLETICLKCLEKQPTQRYHSAAALSDDLRSFLRGDPIAARPVRFVEQVVRLAGRYPAVFAAVATMLIVMATSFGLVTWKWRDATRAREGMRSALLQAETSHYASLISQVQRNLDDNKFDQAMAALDQCKPSMRSIEYEYLRRRIQQSMKVLHGHVGPVRAVVCQSDWLASAGEDGTIRIWDVATGATQAVLTAHQGGVACLSLNQDGSLLASGGLDGMVRIWDVAQRTTKATIRVLDGQVTAVCFDHSGKLLVTGDDSGGVRGWSSVDGIALFDLEVHDGVVRSLSFGVDDKTLAVATDQRPMKIGKPRADYGRSEIKLWDVSSRSQIQSLEGHQIGRSLDLHCVAYSPSKQFKRFASAGGLSIKLWDAINQDQPVLTLRGHRQTVRSIVISQYGRHLASGDGNGVVKIWDAHRGLELATYTGHKGNVYAVAFCGEAVVSAGKDGTVRIWQRDQSHQMLANKLMGNVTAVDVDSSGLVVRALAGGNRHLAIRTPKDQVTKNATLKTSTNSQSFETEIVGQCRLIAISPDNSKFACAGDDGVYVLSHVDGRTLCQLADSHDCTAIAWSEDSTLIVTGHDDDRVCMWDGESGLQTVEYLGQGQAVQSVVYCAATRTAATISGSNAVRLLRDGALVDSLRVAESTVLRAVAMNADGTRVAAGSADGQLWVWETASRDLLLHVSSEDASAIRAVAFCPDGKRIAALSERHEVTFWDLATGRVIFDQQSKATRLSRAGRFQVSHQAVGGWKLGFGDEPGTFFTNINGEVTWFPAGPSKPLSL